MHCCKQHIYFWIAYIFLFEYILLIQIINVKYNKIQQRYNMLIGKYIFEITIWISVCFQNIFSYDIYYKRFWDNFPQGKLPANPKSNPNPNREAIFLGGNCPDTITDMRKIFERALTFAVRIYLYQSVHTLFN